MMTEKIVTFIFESFAERFLEKIIDRTTVANELIAAYNKCAASFLNEGDGEKYHFSQSQTAEQGILKMFLMPDSYDMSDLINELKHTDNLMIFTDVQVDEFVRHIEEECLKSHELTSLMNYRMSVHLMKQLNGLSAVDTLMTPDAFRTAYNKSIYKLATDLNNRFVGREEEMSRFMDFMDRDNAVVVVSGRQGTGKTRFALEACTAYAAKSGYNVVCLSSIASNLEVTLKLYLTRYPETIVFIDDVNQMTGSLDVIVSMLGQYESLKVVCTVRDYALAEVKKNLRHINYEIQPLSQLTEAEQQEIISDISTTPLENFEIAEIIKKSRSNVRMASMMVRKLNEGGDLGDMEELSQLMDCYYLPVMEMVEEGLGGDALKVMAVIAFYRVINRDDRNSRFIYEFTGVPENDFWNLAAGLHRLEIVDMFEDESVKFSDQQLMAYTFYQIFIERQILSFSDIVLYSLDEYRIVRLRNSFNSVETVWESKCVEKVLSILRVFEKQIDEDCKLLFYSVFWKVFPEETFVYLASMIDPDAIERTDFSDTPELYLHTLTEENPAHILARMAQHWPDKKKRYYGLIVNLVRFGCLYYPNLEEVFQDYEINLTNNEIPAFARRCEFLDFLYEELKSDSSDLTVGRFVLEHWNQLLYVPERCDESFLHSKVWSLLGLFAEAKYPDLRKSIASSRIDDFVDFDLFERVFDYSDFVHCYQIWCSLRFSSRKLMSQISDKFTSSLWPVFMKLQNKKGGLPRGNHLFVAKQILRIREGILEARGEYYDCYEEQMLTVLLEKSKKKYLEVLDVFLNHCPLCIRPYVIIRYLAKYPSEEDLTELIAVLESSCPDKIQCFYKLMAYACLDSGLVSKDRLGVALDFFRSCDFSEMSLHYLLGLIDKYESIISAETLWNLILTDIFNKISSGEDLDCNDPGFAKYAVLTASENMDKLISVLKHLEQHSRVSMLSDEFYRFILEKRPDFFKIMFRYRAENVNKLRCCSYIWNLKSIKAMFKFVLVDPQFRWTIYKIEHTVKGTPEEYKVLRELMVELIDVPIALRVLFTIVANRFRYNIVDFAESFVSNNRDIELFKELRFSPDHYTYSGSFMPIQDALIKTLTDIRDALMCILPLPVEHIAYLNERISACESSKRDIRKREFAE